METTLDNLLNRRLTLQQPAEGYRIAVDTVLLAAAVQAKTGDRVLDLGCGAGGAMLCLACRVPGIFAAGIEIQPELADLCRKNIELNKFGTSMNVVLGDAATAAIGKDFDHVMMNPPYHDEARHDVSPHDGKRTANSGKAGELVRWITAAAGALKPSGVLTLIHRADRLDEILDDVRKYLNTIEILPIAPKAGAHAKRVIIRAAKGQENVVRSCRNFVLHKVDGGYTEEAEAVLRHMAPLEFTAQ